MRTKFNGPSHSQHMKIVRDLYAVLGRWELVAKACNGRNLHHTSGYYHQIATGRIRNPPEDVLENLRYAPEAAEIILLATEKHDTRKTIHPSPEFFEWGNRERKPLSLTWPQLLDSLMKARLDEQCQD